MVEDFEVFGSKSLFFSLVFLWEAKQDIHSSIYFTSTIFHLEVVLRKFLGLINLSKIRALCDYEMAKIIMIDEDENFVLATF